MQMNQMPGGLAPAGASMDYYIPQWEERTSYGVRRVDPYTKLFEDRIIFLGTPISDDIANAVMAQLLCLQSMDPERDVQIYINSPGGSFTALTAIYDTMRFIKPDVQTVCLGQAASAAAILLAAGAPGKRYALPHAKIMMHQPSGGLGGTASDIKILAEQIIATKREMAQLIAEHTGRPVEQIEADSDRDRWFTASQALEYGFIDHVYERAAQIQTDAPNQ